MKKNDHGKLPVGLLKKCQSLKKDLTRALEILGKAGKRHKII